MDGQDGMAVPPPKGLPSASGKGGGWSGQLPPIRLSASGREVGSFLNPRIPYLSPGSYEETLPNPSELLWAQ